nr:hypothetical protein [Tanacetum cinerariifolium]
MTDSVHFTVSYTSISSPKRSWDIPDVDPYKEASLQAIEQVSSPLSPTYLPDPIELDKHVPMYVSKPEYPEYLELIANDIIAKDQPYADDVVPTTLSLGYNADSNLEEDLEEKEHADYDDEPEEEKDPKEEDLEEEEEYDDNAASEEEPLEGSDDIKPSEKDETADRVAELLVMPTLPPSPLTPMSSPLPLIPSPPLLVPSPPMPSSPLPTPIPVETHAPEEHVAAALLMLPSTTRRSEVPEADMSPQKRLCFGTLTFWFKVGESSSATARPPRDLYGFVDTTKAEAIITRMHAKTLHDTNHKKMTAIELVNLRVSYEAHTRQRDGKEFHLQLRDAQRNRAGIRAEIVELRDRGTLLKDAYIKLCQDLVRSEARNE